MSSTTQQKGTKSVRRGLFSIDGSCYIRNVFRQSAILHGPDESLSESNCAVKSAGGKLHRV